MSLEMKPGHIVRLLVNGEEYYPRVLEAIAAAKTEVLVETFILFDDAVGRQLRDALIAAARRGVRVDLTVDGWGTCELCADFVGGMTGAGVRYHSFDPKPKLLGYRTNAFRRLHRKLVAIDGVLAFIGGINFSADHLRSFGPEAKEDYAMELAGPVVDDIRNLMLDALGRRHVPRPRWSWRRLLALLPARSRLADVVGSVVGPGAQCALVQRDNAGHKRDIETYYRVAIRTTRRQLIIANAYFFPGYRFLRDLRRAARRGVDVRLIVQGNPDMPIVGWANRMLYAHLLKDRVRVFEYCERPLHGKVAVFDDEWSTVGSSNLDPLSLALNLEANLVIRDAAFAGTLRARLGTLMASCCREVTLQHAPPRTLWRGVVSAFVFHVLRRFPAWAGWLPAHKPRLVAGAPAAHLPAAGNDPALPDADRKPAAQRAA